MRYYGGVLVLVLFGVCWCIYDALALCYLEDLLLVITLLVWRSVSTCWRTFLDDLVLEVSLEDLSLVRYTWRFLWLMHLEM